MLSAIACGVFHVEVLGNRRHRGDVQPQPHITIAAKKWWKHLQGTRVSSMVVSA